MKILVVVLLLMVNMYSCAQEKYCENCILISVDDAEDKFGTLIFTDLEVLDTLKGRSVVAVTFDKKINTKRKLNVADVFVSKFILESNGHNHEGIEISYSQGDSMDVYNELEKYIIKKYKEKFVSLYENQPYSKMKGRQVYDYKKMQFSCPFMIIPERYKNVKLKYPHIQYGD
jgi:hypothetical protein